MINDLRERRHYEALRAANAWEQHRKRNRRHDLTMWAILLAGCAIWGVAIVMLLEHL